MTIRIPVIILCFVMLGVLAGADARGDVTGLRGWEEFSASKDARRLLAWTRCQMKEMLGGDRCLQRLAVSVPPYFGRHGLFVTLVRKGRVRGCYGAFSHQSSDMEATLKDYLYGALKRDARYRSVELIEAGDTRIIITITGEEHTIDDIHSVDLSRHGLVVTTSENEAYVFVPSEIKSIDHLKKRLSGKEIQQVAAFMSVTLEDDR